MKNEKYNAERDEVLESRDPDMFLEFIKKNKKSYGRFYDDYMAKVIKRGKGFILLTMAKMAAQSNISAEAKAYYKRVEDESRYA